MRSDRQLPGSDFRNTMQKQMLELELVFAHLSNPAGDGLVSSFNHMERLSLGTLMAIKAKCDTGFVSAMFSTCPVWILPSVFQNWLDPSKEIKKQMRSECLFQLSEMITALIFN